MVEALPATSGPHILRECQIDFAILNYISLIFVCETPEFVGMQKKPVLSQLIFFSLLKWITQHINSTNYVSLGKYVREMSLSSRQDLVSCVSECARPA